MRTPALCFVLALLLAPGPAHAGAANLARAGDGHWYADARINGRPVRVLIDTGATLVALTRDDARRAGVDVQRLDFDAQVATAAGPARAARVRLASVSIQNARLDHVDAMVFKDGLSISILGMSFLGRLQRLDMRGSNLSLED
ncbi:MAG: TIGR02281 family clan AA aspartic protease [Hyphomonadaceae bacterium]